MAKEINCRISVELPGGGASPSLKQIGPAIGGKVGNIMDFCKKFNAATDKYKGKKIRALVTAYKDREKSFDIEIRGIPSVEQIKARAIFFAGETKGSKEPNRVKVGTISLGAIEEIAKEQQEFINGTFCIDGIKNMLIGTAKRMGIEIK